MVCIAAFIILALIGVFVALVSIFKPKIGKAYLKALKKAWAAYGKRSVCRNVKLVLKMM